MVYHLSNGSLFFFKEPARACRQVHAMVAVGVSQFNQLRGGKGMLSATVPASDGARKALPADV